MIGNYFYISMTKFTKNNKQQLVGILNINQNVARSKKSSARFETLRVCQKSYNSAIS